MTLCDDVTLSHGKVPMSSRRDPAYVQAEAQRDAQVCVCVCVCVCCVLCVCVVCVCVVCCVCVCVCVWCTQRHGEMPSKP